MLGSTHPPSPHMVRYAKIAMTPMAVTASSAKTTTTEESKLGGALFGSHESSIGSGTNRRNPRIPIPNMYRMNSRSVHSYHPTFPCRSRVVRTRVGASGPTLISNFRGVGPIEGVVSQGRLRSNKDPCRRHGGRLVFMPPRPKHRPYPYLIGSRA